MCLSLSHLSLFTTTSPSALSPLSLHDALPIFMVLVQFRVTVPDVERFRVACEKWYPTFEQDGARNQQVWNSESKDRKSTRLNSSHTVISYAVFCLKKKTSIRRRGKHIMQCTAT